MDARKLVSNIVPLVYAAIGIFFTLMTAGQNPLGVTLALPWSFIYIKTVGTLALYFPSLYNEQFPSAPPTDVVIFIILAILLNAYIIRLLILKLWKKK